MPRRKLSRHAVAYTPKGTGRLDRPVLPQAVAFEHRKSADLRRVRTFWPFEKDPIGPVDTLVYQCSSDQMIELGHSRLVLLYESVEPENAIYQWMGIPFFCHMIYGRGIIMAGEPAEDNHEQTYYKWLESTQQARSVMQFVCENYEWWMGRHHDHTITEASSIEHDEEGEMGEEGPSGWAHSIQ